ncbi:MAG: PAS domain-containing protein [Bdellovibrionales bacterium]|nr:PAS domain-containing protein [Bdellovibrionales bacterium]
MSSGTEHIWISGVKDTGELAPVEGVEFRAFHGVDDLAAALTDSERLLVIAPVAVVEEVRGRFGSRILAARTLPSRVEARAWVPWLAGKVLEDARLQHDLEAAEAVAWTGVRSGRFEDPFLEFLGESVLDIAASADRTAVERALLAACQRLAPVEEVRLVPEPGVLSARELGAFRLAVPIQFGGELKAHAYVRFAPGATESHVEKAGEAVLSLTDAVALAVDRDRMLMQAEETRAVWEASFDTVGDPVAILDVALEVVRANRAFARFAGVSAGKLAGKRLDVEGLENVAAKAALGEREWQMEGRPWQVFLDRVDRPSAPGAWVLRLRDISVEKSLTEKIAAKAHVAEMGILVSSVAHEVNNPIAGILATSQLMLKELPEGHAWRDDVQSIQEAAARARDIVQKMLSLVRKSDDASRVVSLRDCLLPAVDLLKGEAKRLHVKFEGFDGISPEASVEMNKNRLMQVFFHLLQQGLKAVAEKQKAGLRCGWRIACAVSVDTNSVEVTLTDAGDSIVHQYEVQSSVAWTVSRMILEEAGGKLSFGFGPDGGNRILMQLPRAG